MKKLQNTAHLCLSIMIRKLLLKSYPIQIASCM